MRGSRADRQRGSSRESLVEINKQQLSVWYFVLAFVAIVLLQDMFTAQRHTETLAYSEFKSLLRAGKASDLVITDQTITGRLADSGLEDVLPAERIEAIRR